MSAKCSMPVVAAARADDRNVAHSASSVSGCDRPQPNGYGPLNLDEMSIIVRGLIVLIDDTLGDALTGSDPTRTPHQRTAEAAGPPPQEDLAHKAEIDRSYIGGVERGERNLTFKVLCAICAALECDVATLTNGIPGVPQ